METLAESQPCVQPQNHGQKDGRVNVDVLLHKHVRPHFHQTNWMFK